ncbi:MAG: hypothetical protein CMI95_06845 [Pelagibacteraceae bacterium]|nr:hypothetical protein [Pelagibacteraceae bacterium]PPR51495.1 MAG: hypothetical protein CFH20_00561 [Alphaproteobacteria bacterium MarineAlpha5_Bin10]|tara:strand:+ start:4426 stop:4830 length:405 start_codon:yes stop_codon:yes gene_type:complete
MSKEIIDISQIQDGGINPITGIHEKPTWNIKFADGDERVLFKHKMIEYLSMGFQKQVETFKKVVIKTKTEETLTWLVIFRDYRSQHLTIKNFFNLLLEGHSHRNEDAYMRWEHSLSRQEMRNNINIRDDGTSES